MSKAERTRQFIVEKTAPIFNVKGYAGTSLSDMTDATGLTKGSIYGNFANKDEVAMAAFDHNLEKILNIYGAEIAKHDSARDRLLAYVHVYNNFLKYPFPVGGCPILNTAVESDDMHPVLKERAAKAVHKWKDKLVDIIEAGVREQEFKKITNPEQVALSIIAMLEGCIMVSKVTGNMHYRNLITQALEKFITEL